MKIYILTCVNEEGRVVSAEPFKSFADAAGAMRREYYAEAEDYDEENRGYVADTTAFVGNEEYRYFWQIHETEL